LFIYKILLASDVIQIKAWLSSSSEYLKNIFVNEAAEVESPGFAFGDHPVSKVVKLRFLDLMLA
jgi:hypothetical protein